MNKLLNLSELSGKIARQKVQVIDSALAQYVKSAVELLQAQGKDITKYSLVSVSNLMTFKNDTVKIDQQWRIVPISELENLPTFEDER